ncbi:MAG: type I DNA topoisomerase [Spirochaetia bacterium]|jgi:DNA topoisomerase-1|nr:type I DNA topoisomerase [Spirochaetia bacterium]
MKNKPLTLVIVESPSKAKTINKYLGSSYTISSSVGHIIDLPKSRLAIDVDNDFKPEYITIRGKAKILNELKKKASLVSQVLIATDPDREGEAISWHLANALAPKNSNIKRIVFNEITEKAVKDAVTHPRAIDMDMVNAQQARRILDRIVGYNISPILWKKVKRGLSAGRVQSVALKVICDRESEISGFIPKEFWSIDVECVFKNKFFTAALVQYQDKKINITNSEQSAAIAAELEKNAIIVKEKKVKERKRNPQPPYITSKLQQDAATRLGFTSQKTMMVAQQLYQGVDITKQGPVGLITYMRTDSTRISDIAINAVRGYIGSNFSKEYLPKVPNTYTNKKNAQDAHEAIRPTDVNLTPDSVKSDLTKDQYRLYDLIWKRFVSSQMTQELSEATTITLLSGDYTLRVAGSTVLFKGFTVLDKDDKTEKTDLPDLKEGDKVGLHKILQEQHFTTPPPRFNDASLVKFLEESGIGRPSTYAPTLDTLLKRYYVVRQGRQLVPTVLGKLVSGIMSDNFPEFISVDFTAGMEENLDQIEEAKKDWVSMLHEFYTPFIQVVHDAENNISNMKGVLDEETDIVCEKCGSVMLKKLGRFGFFLACSGFPECRNAKPLPLGKCPSCQTGDVVKRASKKGRGAFYSCTNYPECEFLTRENPSSHSCPQCGSILFEKRLKGKGGQLSCLNPKCSYVVALPDDEEKAAL